MLVGAAITAGANYLLAVRKERAEAEKDKAIRAHELRTAARLIANELSEANDVAAAFGNFEGKISGLMWSSDQWHKHKDILAREISLDELNDVALAAEAIDRGTRLVATLDSSDDLYTQLLADYCEGIVKTTSTGLDALQANLGDQKNTHKSAERSKY